MADSTPQNVRSVPPPIGADPDLGAPAGPAGSEEPDPYTTPRAPVESSHDLHPSERTASPARRLIGLNIDFAIAGVLGGMLAAGSRLLPVHEDLPGALGLGAFALYCLFKDALPGGQSLAKRVLWMRVVSIPELTPCSAARSVVRNLFLFLGPLDAFVILFGNNMRLGDHVARTRVLTATKAA